MHLQRKLEGREEEDLSGRGGGEGGGKDGQTEDEVWVMDQEPSHKPPLCRKHQSSVNL